jgi:23S rRNA (guanine745-N1)-methyltransferase
VIFVVKKNMTRSDTVLELFRTFQNIFRCPVCGVNLTVGESKNLICDNKHSFDLSRTGYVNLLTKAHTTKYRKEMFAARNRICHSGFYDSLLDRIADSIIKHPSSDAGESSVVLDAGCGGGVHLSLLTGKLRSSGLDNVQGVGIDIAKEGIQLAARDYRDIVWVVGDITDMPVQPESINVLLNILSPSHYSEFHRVLKKNGILIKVTPGEKYLAEIREPIFKDSEKENYDPSDKTDHMGKHFDVTSRDEIFYKVPVPIELLLPLVRMTPLSWNLEPAEIETLASGNLDQITIDLKITVGIKTI